jgi:hypothetical protein
VEAAGVESFGWISCRFVKADFSLVNIIENAFFQIDKSWRQNRFYEVKRRASLSNCLQQGQLLRLVSNRVTSKFTKTASIQFGELKKGTATPPA